MKDAGVLDQGVGSGVQSLYILKVETRWLALELDIGCGERGSQ